MEGREREGERVTFSLGPSAAVKSSVPGFRLTEESTTMAMCGEDATITTMESESPGSPSEEVGKGEEGDRVEEEAGKGDKGVREG